MKITGSINDSEFKRTLKKWERLTGKGVEEGIGQIASASAKQLAAKVQPYGLSDQIGNRFLKSIELQVTQVWFGINLGYYELQGNLERTYNSMRRNGKIRPRRFRDSKGKRWRSIVGVSERNNLIRKQQAKAGKAKAAWISAGQKISGKKIRVTGKWIRRHVATGYASGRKTKQGFKAVYELHNQTPYLKHIQREGDLKKALASGRKNGMSSLKRAINYQIKKANR